MRSFWTSVSLFGWVVCTCVLVGPVCVTGETGGNGTKSERYPLINFDFGRVELPFVICLWILIASLGKIGFHLYHKLPSVIPESCLLIILGLIVGAILHYSHVATTSDYVLNADIFFIYLLPPIIFDAGYFMPIRSFFDNIGSVLLLAVVNTLMNTALIGFSLFAVSYWGWVGRSISMLHCLIFSALISAVDPVAVIATFEEVHVNQMLYIIVFGESLLNDGVTVVLYHMMEGFIELGEENIIAVDVVTGVGSFFIIALGGTLIGILFGFFGGFITKYTEHVKIIEPLFVFVLGYLMYLTSEMMHLSGILALSFGGIVLRHYVEHNVEKKTATTIRYMMKMVANISETIIFMFLGLSTIVDTLDWNLAFIFFALFFCLVYRLLGVTILAWLLNRRRLVKLTMYDQFVMAYGGLRGGIAFCLALSLEEELIPEKKLFVTATIIIVFFTVFIQGITIKPVVNALKVKRHVAVDPSMNEKIHETVIDHLMAGVEELTSRSSHNLMRTRFRRFNHKYLRPLLSRDKPTVKTTKLVNTFHAINEQEALKAASSVPRLSITPMSNGSVEDLMSEDHKRSLIRNRGVRGSQADTEADRIALQQALNGGRSLPQWHQSSKYRGEDGDQRVKPVIRYYKQNQSSPQQPQQQDLKSNGGVLRFSGGQSNKSESASTDSEGVTINFRHRDSSADESLSGTPITETTAEKELPWKHINDDPSPTTLSEHVPNNDPVTAPVPTWVNNLSYSHITETGSPYVSPDVTILPQRHDTHSTVYTLFPMNKEPPEADKIPFPNPWGQTEALEDNPQVSPMVTETGERSCDFLHSSHMGPAPAHHVIKSSNQNMILESDTSRKEVKHTLSDVASAPDLAHHWQPIRKPCYTSPRLQSNTVLFELALQEGVKNRVQEWLSHTDSSPQVEEPGALDVEEGEEECDPELSLILEEELDRHKKSKH